MPEVISARRTVVDFGPTAATTTSCRLLLVGGFGEIWAVDFGPAKPTDKLRVVGVSSEYRWNVGWFQTSVPPHWQLRLVRFHRVASGMLSDDVDRLSLRCLTAGDPSGYARASSCVGIP